jgi:AcrR family transcriptional regulator
VVHETPQPPRDQRRAIAERNIEAILDAADALLERRSQANVSAVAAEAGLSRVTVYAHFPSRNALLEAVIERAVERTMALLDEADPENGSPIDALERLIVVGWQELDRNRARVHAGLQQLGPAALTRAHHGAQLRIRALVERGRNEGVFRTDVPTDWLVTSLIALMHASAEEVHAGRTDAPSALHVLIATIRDLFVGRGRA